MPPIERDEDRQLVLSEVLRDFETHAKFATADLSRYRCPYVEWGEGPPLIFIHGLADDARSFVLPISILRRHFRCIGYNLPNGNGDGAQLAKYHHPLLAEDLDELRDFLDIEVTSLYGSSFGSTIALVAMHRHKDRFPRAVLQGGFAQRPLAPAERLLSSFARYWPGTMRVLPFRIAILTHNHHRTFEWRGTENWDYFLERTGKAPLAAVAHRALMLHQLDLRALLPEITQEVLLICGECDPLVDRSCEDVLLHGLPHATRATLENCGHYPYYTHPELLAELTKRFLTSLPCEL